MYRRLILLIVLFFLFVTGAVHLNPSILSIDIISLSLDKGYSMRTKAKYIEPTTTSQIRGCVNALFFVCLVCWIFAQEISISGAQDCKLTYGGCKKITSHVVLDSISRKPFSLADRRKEFNVYNPKEYQSNFYHFLLEGKQKCWVLPASQSIVQLFKEIDNNRAGTSLMNFEWARYETFKTFPMESPAMPTRLAANGFFYTNKEDTVMCFSCNVKYGGWKSGDIPSEIHMRLSPNCAFLAKTDNTNIPIHDFQETTIQGATGGIGFTTDGKTTIQQHSRQSQSSKSETAKDQPHKYPDYETTDKRRDSFVGWRSEEIVAAEALISAGFYYAGFGDCVRCFSCGGGLRNWEFGDAPWEEHARWFPFCRYLNEHKTPEFISRFRDTHTDTDEECDKNETAVSSGKHELETNQQSRDNVKIQEQQLPVQTEFVLNATPSDIKDPSNVQTENAKLKSQLVCKICMDMNANVVFVPCGHMISCESCAARLRKCAVCRKLIKGRITAFMT